MRMPLLVQHGWIAVPLLAAVVIGYLYIAVRFLRDSTTFPPPQRPIVVVDRQWLADREENRQVKAFRSRVRRRRLLIR
jgi:hypothetical protein